MKKITIKENGIMYTTMTTNVNTYVKNLYENYEHLIARCNIEINFNNLDKKVTYAEYKIISYTTNYKHTISKIKEDALLKSCASNISIRKGREKFDKKTSKKSRNNENLCNIKFDFIEFMENSTSGLFDENEVCFIVQSAFRRAEMNHVHYKSKIKKGDEKGKIKSMWNVLDRNDKGDKKGRYIDKFKLYEEYDNCFNEFFLQVWNLYAKKPELFKYAEFNKQERAKYLCNKLAYYALNSIEKAILEISYYKSKKVKIEREFVKNTMSIENNKNEDGTIKCVDTPEIEYKYDYVIIKEDIKKMFTGKDREILVLKLQGKTTREIAEQLNVSTKTISKILKQVKEYLLSDKVDIDYCNR